MAAQRGWRIEETANKLLEVSAKAQEAPPVNPRYQPSCCGGRSHRGLERLVGLSEDFTGVPYPWRACGRLQPITLPLVVRSPFILISDFRDHKSDLRAGSQFL